jgi:hypothetical protein
VIGGTGCFDLLLCRHQDIESGRNIPSPALWMEKIVVTDVAKALRQN